MAVTIVRIDWTSRDISGNAVSLSFDDVEVVNLKKDSEAASSHGTIILKNSYDRFITGFTQPFTKYNQDVNDIIFKEGDSVKVYAAGITSFRAIDVTSGSADLLMSGEIAEVNVKGDIGGAKVTLKIVDKTYVVLNQLKSFAYTTTSALNAPKIVQDVVRFVTDDVDDDEESYDASGNLVVNGRFGIDARLVSAGGFIEDTRQGGSVFPNITIAKTAAPAYDWVRDLSSIDSTNDFAGSDDADAPTQDRTMLFYVDELNRLHWFYPQDVVSSTLNGAINDSVTTVTLTNASSFASQGSVFIDSERLDYTGKSSNDLTGVTRGANNTDAASHSNGAIVKNAIVIIEGDTSSGFSLINFNLTKKTFDIVNFVIFNCGGDLLGNGITSFYFDKATKSKNLQSVYKTYNHISSKLLQEEVNDGRLTKDNAVTSAFTFKGNRYKETTGNYGGGTITTSWGVAVANDTAYNDAFRAECIIRGKRSAQKLVNKRGNPRWKGSMEFLFHRFTAGEAFEFTSTRAGINQQALRIKTVLYNLAKTGGFVTVMVEEDEERLSP